MCTLCVVCFVALAFCTSSFIPHVIIFFCANLFDILVNIYIHEEIPGVYFEFGCVFWHLGLFYVFWRSLAICAASSFLGYFTYCLHPSMSIEYVYRIIWCTYILYFVYILWYRSFHGGYWYFSELIPFPLLGWVCGSSKM